MPPVFKVEKLMSPTSSPAQVILFWIDSTWGIGLTVIVKVSVFPELLIPPFSKVGVTETVVTIGLFPVLVAINSILPDPELTRPVEGSVLVHS